MDRRQKDLLSSAQLAHEIDFDEIAKYLQLVKSVSKERAEEIKAKVKTPVARTLKLLLALQESDSPTAFDDFILILEITKNVKALRIVSSNGFNTGQSSGGNREILRRAFDKYFRGSAQYPLGMYSGTTVTSQPSSAYMGYHQGESNLSPLKERHQATLISSAGNTIGSQLSTLDSGYSSQLKASPLNTNFSELSMNPATPSTTDQQNINNSGYVLKSKDFSATQMYNNQTSQTPISPKDEPLFTLSHSDDRTSIGMKPSSENQEPVVCWHPYAQPQSGPGSRSSSPHLCHPSYISSSSGSDTSSESLHLIDPNLILDKKIAQALEREGTKKMTRVELATVCHNNPEEDYKMTARPRGPCLIVNNIDFEAEMFPTRKGSDEDAKNFDNIFQQLGFIVIMRRNQTADQMRKLFKDVAAECKPEHEALFVFILSHGSEHGIYGTDGMEVCLESEIISCFDNRNCKAMLGKPKIFALQACRGSARDCGGGDGEMTDSIAWSPELERASRGSRVPESWLPSSQPPDGRKRKHPIRTDMLIIYSCLAGFVSVRNETAGSWLGVALAYFIMKHAHEKDLVRILNLVTNDVIQRESSSGHIQSIELKLLGWTKNLYFNPGIYL